MKNQQQEETVQLYGIIKDSTITILIDEKLLNVICSSSENRQVVIVDLVDLLVDEFNFMNVNILISRNGNVLQMKSFLQFMSCLFDVKLHGDLSQLAIEGEVLDPYDWIGLSCEL
ncbi:hypothetical protein I9W82_003988 [Candida metapsilosis]|uniref:Uncharacterized protein n=1 Tax=Candida metapsilosis TaxID=273372 RepID=A0A8H8DB22_9ASCO|nr:hypothetical protein I9W82_003988 [Candida metapsilosis]